MAPKDRGMYSVEEIIKARDEALKERSDKSKEYQANLDKKSQEFLDVFIPGVFDKIDKNQVPSNDVIKLNIFTTPHSISYECYNDSGTTSFNDVSTDYNSEIVYNAVSRFNPNKHAFKLYESYAGEDLYCCHYTFCQNYVNAEKEEHEDKVLTEDARQFIYHFLLPELGNVACNNPDYKEVFLTLFITPYGAFFIGNVHEEKFSSVFDKKSNAEFVHYKPEVIRRAAEICNNDKRKLEPVTANICTLSINDNTDDTSQKSNDFESQMEKIVFKLELPSEAK